MVRLRGGHLVLADRLMSGGSLVFEGGTIVHAGAGTGPSPGEVDCQGCWVLPGFIDAHIHGVYGTDVLADGEAVARVAARLPRHGVTAFCPTSVACAPETLAHFLAAVAAAANTTPAGSARVLGAHLESNFVNPDYRGAQPHACLRLPPRPGELPRRDGVFTGAAILEAIAAQRPHVRLITVAPELDGGMDLVAALVAAGHRVSLGHSAASFEIGQAAIAAGARHATHLFNRMPPLSHREPGLAGAVLADDAVTCEVICDGYHVHPAMVQLALRAKGPGGVLAITDATAGAGLPVGATTRLGDHVLHVRDRRAELADGTLAGSVLTMDGAFRVLVREVGLSVPDAARLCATAPATALGRSDLGCLAEGLAADVVVLDERLQVRQTWVAGVQAWNSAVRDPVSPGEGL